MQPAVELRQIRKRYRDGAAENEVLRGVDLTVEEGSFVCVVGASGSGKSTLLHLAGGLDRPDSGEVFVKGRALASLDDGALSALRARSIGFVFQSFNLLPGLSALDNVLLPHWFADAGAEARRRAEAALERVGLAGKTHRRPSELSGGERQRVAIARALFARPALLLADEPTGNLDSATAGQIIELFQSLHRDERMTLVVVTHEDRVSRAADRVVRMVDGKVGEAA